MNSLYKSFFIFAAGLALGVVGFSGKSSKSQIDLTNSIHAKQEQNIKNGKSTFSFQPSANDKEIKTPNLAKLNTENKPADQKSANYNPDGIYKYEDSRDQRDQTPTAPPSDYKTANVPNLSEAEEQEESEADEVHTRIQYVNDDSSLENQLKSKMDEIEDLKKANAKNSGSASFSSFGVYGHFQPEENLNEGSGSGSNGAYYGGSFGNNNEDDIESADALPQVFNLRGVNIANNLLSKNSITMPEYVDYVSQGLETSTTSLQRLSITNLSNKLDAEAFTVLAQYSSGATAQMNKHLDSELSKKMKTVNGLRFLSRQIANTESIMASQLAVNTVGLILESENIPVELYDVLLSDVVTSLNNLPPSHPSYNQGRQLAALIPGIINS